MTYRAVGPLSGGDSILVERVIESKSLVVASSSSPDTHGGMNAGQFPFDPQAFLASVRLTCIPLSSCASDDESRIIICGLKSKIFDNSSL